MITFKYKTVDGKRVKQMTSSSQSKLIGRLRRIQQAHPHLDLAHEGFREIVKRHELASKGPGHKGTQIAGKAKQTLPVARKMVKQTGRKLKRIRQMRAIIGTN